MIGCQKKILKKGISKAKTEVSEEDFVRVVKEINYPYVILQKEEGLIGKIVIKVTLEEIEILEKAGEE